jgi:LysR family transcriptional regulator, hydrogen peroxide-inducible genes activator
MEMHQLRYFVAVAQTGSFSRAAEACFVSQPSLSQQIAKLEKSVGQRLLDRLARGVHLTDAGRQLLDSALSILATVDDAERRLKDDANLAGCRLSVGAIPTIAPYLLPILLQRFAKKHPGVEMTIHEDVTRNLIGAVSAGELDLAILALPIDDERVASEELWTEPLLLALPRRHRLARKKQITMDELRAERFLLLTEMHCLGEQVISYCRAHECQPRIACRSAQIATMRALIEQGLGITLLPEMATRRSASKGIVYRRLTGDVPSRTIAAIRHKHRYHSGSGQRFLDVLRDYGKPFQNASQPRRPRGAVA